MKLERLLLHNFRCFRHLAIDFNDDLTVIVAENGAGKTAVLDAIAIGFGRYLTKLPGIAGIKIRDGDVRIERNERPAHFMVVGWEARTLDGSLIEWAAGRRNMASPKPLRISEQLQETLKKGMKQIDDFTNQLVEAEASGQAYFLPVIAYYGTSRAIREEVQRRRGLRKQFTRFEALAGALEPDSSFRSAFEWFNAMEDQERREKEVRRDFDYRLPELQTVRTAIVRMLGPEFSNPRTEIRPLRFVIDRAVGNGEVQTLRITQLSDGYRVVLGLVMDLARRMTQANSHFVADGNLIMNPLDLPAIALIDEVDLHLHPSWQQRVLTDLMRTFTKTQFIVTTHSPQVLSRVDASCIRVLRQTMDPETGQQVSAIERVSTQTLGVSSADLLARIMKVDPVPAVPESEMLSEYQALIQQNQHETPEGKAMRVRLNEHFGADHPVMRECDRLIRLQAFKQRLPRIPRNAEG